MILATAHAHAPVTVHSRPSARPKLTRDQVRNRRYQDWLNDFEVGRPDPVTGVLTPRPVWLIAKIAGVGESTVRFGLDVARRLKAEVASVE